MKRIPPSAIPAVVLSIVLLVPTAVHSTGLYMNFPSWFPAADTASVDIVFSETDLQCEFEDATVLGFEVVRRLGGRVSTKLGVVYPVIRTGDHFRHGLGDGSVSTTYRIRGDTLNVKGLFLRNDIRIPIGSGALRPYAFRSSDGGVYPDVGAGLEVRTVTSFLGLRGSATYTFAGQREREGDLIHDNFFLLVVMLGLEISPSTSFQITACGMRFDNGDYRECYFAAFSRKLGSQAHLRLMAGVDSGDEKERLFNSLVSIVLTFRLPGGSSAGK